MPLMSTRMVPPVSSRISWTKVMYRSQEYCTLLLIAPWSAASELKRPDSGAGSGAGRERAGRRSKDMVGSCHPPTTTHHPTADTPLAGHHAGGRGATLLRATHTVRSRRHMNNPPSGSEFRGRTYTWTVAERALPWGSVVVKTQERVPPREADTRPDLLFHLSG